MNSSYLLLMPAGFILPAIYLIYLAFTPMLESRGQILAFANSAMFFLAGVLGVLALLFFWQGQVEKIVLFTQIDPRFDATLVFSGSQIWWFLGHTMAFLIYSLAFSPFASSSRKFNLNDSIMLVLAYLLGNFIIFAENLFIALVFFEVLAFVSHLRGLLFNKDVFDSAELSSYLKRKVMHFLLLALLGFNLVVNALPNDFMICLVVILYLVSTIYMRPTYLFWPHAASQVFICFAANVLLVKFFALFPINNGLQWIGLMAIIISIISSLQSIFTTRGISAFFYYLLAINFEATFLSIYYNKSPDFLIALISGICGAGVLIGVILASIVNLDEVGVKKNLMFVIIISHLYIIGIPGTIGFYVYKSLLADNILLFGGFLVMNFLASVSLSKILSTSKINRDYWRTELRIQVQEAAAWIIIIIAILGSELLWRGSFLGEKVFDTNLSGLLNVQAGLDNSGSFLYEMLICIGMVVTSAVVGFFISNNQNVILYSRYLDSAVMKSPKMSLARARQLNERFMSLMPHACDFLLSGLAKAYKRIADCVTIGDELIGRGLWSEWEGYTGSLSVFVRYIQNGNARAYLFFSLLFVAILGMVLTFLS